MTIITLQFTGIDKVRAQLARLSGPQAADAYAKAINDTAFQVRRTMQAEFTAKFDRPTPYILRSVQFKGATAAALSATVAPTYFGGKGVDPQQVLKAQEAGGSRRDKRSEVALRRAGILPNGFQTVIPRSAFPGSADTYGNLKGSFITQLISYFRAFGEQGYRANATDRRRKAIGKGTATVAGRRYFVSYGKLRGNRSSHLPPGIWAASGTGGSNVRPVLMFTRAGRYRPLIAMEGIAKKADAENYLARRLRFRIRQAAEALG